MTPRGPRRPEDGGNPGPKRRPSGNRGASAPSWLLRALRGELAARALSPVRGLVLSIPLFFACLFLVIGWRIGPQRMIDAARLRKLTAHAQGRIVESWMALDFKPADMEKHRLWRPLARESLCAVVEYDPGWTDAPVRKAFCGSHDTYNDSYLPHDMRQILKGVPFSWPHDARGFAVPEIRMSAAALGWLATHPEPDPMPNDPPTKTALESLRLDIDQPVALAIAGWMSPATTIPLAFDPHDPRGALPAGFIAKVLDQPPPLVSLVVFAILLVPGVLVWIVAMSLMLGQLQRWAFWFLTLVPLLALPWWGEWMPRYIGGMNSMVGEVVTSFLGDLDRLGYIESSAPDRAFLAHGERVVWRLEDGLYAGTLGRLRFTPPHPAPKSKGEAFRVLVDSITAQVRALDPSEQAALFVRLRQEKEHGLRGAGYAFEEAAHKAMADPQSGPELRRAANGFLEAWGQYFNDPGSTPKTR